MFPPWTIFLIAPGRDSPAADRSRDASRGVDATVFVFRIESTYLETRYPRDGDITNGR